MKLENTTENKERFFAQYWGQKVFAYNKFGSKSIWRVNFLKTDCLEGEYLELKNLKDISEVDAKILFGILLYSQMFVNIDEDKDLKHIDYICIVKNLLKYNPYCKYFLADAIRRLGYLIDYNGMPPEEIIELGWAKYEKV